MNGSSKITTTPSSAKITLAVLGGKGMLGSDLVHYLSDKFEVEAIDKDNYDSFNGGYFDVLVNANGNSRRFWALEHPYEDFLASTVSVYQSINDFKFNKYIYISSSDVYEDHTSPKTTHEDISVDLLKLNHYGFHKYLAEEIVRHTAKEYCILRSSMMLGHGLRKGPFFDILNKKPLFITPKSKLQLITTKAVAEIVAFSAERGSTGEVFNMGGRGAFSLERLSDYFPQPIEVAPEAETQEYEMNVEKLGKLYSLKTSEEYLKEFLELSNGR